jgi:hypothetical protein
MKFIHKLILLFALIFHCSFVAAETDEERGERVNRENPWSHAEIHYRRKSEF